MIQLLLSFTSVHKPVSFVDDINFWISQNVLELNRDESESGCRCGCAKKKTVKVYTSGTRGGKKRTLLKLGSLLGDQFEESKKTPAQKST